MNEEICQLIRQRRTDLGMTQIQLGEMCGYKGKAAETTVQHWEHGRRDIPIDVVRALAEALKLSLDDLIP